jgi:AcrR family transcriptional regulator
MLSPRSSRRSSIPTCPDATGVTAAVTIWRVKQSSAQQPEHLPPHVRAAWQDQLGKPARSYATGLSTAAVVEAGVALADAGGLDAVTIRALSQSLGFTTMAVYRHIDSREELVTLMIDAALAAPEAAPPQDTSWQDALRGWAAALLGRYRRHPWLLDGPPPGLPTTPHHALWVERALAILEAVPLTLGQKLDIALLVDSHARNIAQLGSATTQSRQASQAVVTELQAVLDSATFPHFIDTLEAGALQDAEPPGLEFGLDCILAGVEALARARRG